MRKGYVQVYTGEGKGKTTAALGLAVRAAGTGLRVFIGQFIKGQRCSEHIALERFKDLIVVNRYGQGLILKKKPTAADKESAHEGLKHARKMIVSKVYDLVILDEINVAAHLGLIEVNDILDLIKRKPAPVELIITGRYAHQKVMDAADLVTEMREVKHYHTQGVAARRGIEK